jgi:hypothetical protein
LPGLWITQRERPLGKRQLLVHEQPPMLHALDLGGQGFEALGDRERLGKDLVDDVTAV